jgi:hypothetical protein
MNKYPIYIISKGRWETRKTSKTLEEMKQPYRIVVEPKEYDLYANVIDKNKILVLPDNFSELGQGSIPVRNWVWEHSINEGYERHWILDDNIEQFNRLNNNLQVKVLTGVIFEAAEDFIDRYENIAFAGFQYDFFAKAKTILPAFYMNTRIYSCTLIKNDLPYRWRGKYNEDTDICLRALKDGWCTVLFYAFIQQKAQTLTVKGGNENIYKETNNRKEFAESLVEQHPDIVKVTWKFNRWHHSVNYNGFKQRLIKKENVFVENKINNYGMKLLNLNSFEKTESAVAKIF